MKWYQNLLHKKQNMKKILVLVFLMMTLSTTIFADDSTSIPSNIENVSLEITKSGNESKRHRAPTRKCVNAYYDKLNNVISITCDMSVEPSISLYLDNNLIDFCHSTNTMFQLPEPHGQYKIEIVGENWMAIGYLDI